MRWRLAVGLASSLVVAGVWLRPAGGGPTSRNPSVVWTSTTHTLDVDGTARSYLLVRPQATSAKLPVLVVLHGHDATPEGEAARTGFRDVVGSAILVYPAGVGESWNAGGCCPPADALGVDDVGFITAVVQDVMSGQPDAAASSVFAAGYSNGARMVYRIVCEAPDLFAGVAAVGAIATGPCGQPAPIPLLQVAYSGDPDLAALDVDNQVAAVRAIDGCTDEAGRTSRGLMTVTSWDVCGPRGRVALAVYEGNSHGWPPGDAYTPSAQHVIWDFLSGLRTREDVSDGRTLVLLRHGRTGWNASGRFQGQADPPLDEVGRRQALAAATALAPWHPFGVVTSDLGRAWQTAAVLGAVCAVPVRADPALREVALGGWEGLDDQTVARLFPTEHASWLRGEDVRRGGGETLIEAGDRVAVAIVAAAAACPPERVLVVVSHGVSLQQAMATLGVRGAPHLANGGWLTLVFPSAPRPSRPAACTLRPSIPVVLAVGRRGGARTRSTSPVSA